MKKYMPLEGLRWSRDSGSTLCDTPQNGRSRTGWGQYSNPDLEIGNVHRTPILPILVEQDAGIFTFNKFFAGETIEILIEGIVLYTSIINEGGIIEIPESITGEVELRLIRESITYHAFVNL